MTTTDDTPQTKTDSYQQTTDDGTDDSLRRQVAQSLADQPATTAQLADRFPERSANAIRPRVNELLRMDCVERRDTTVNPSGHEAYLHHLTERGERYLAGECDPDPAPTLAALKDDVVEAARAVCADASDVAALAEAVKAHDAAKVRRNPDWSPPHILGDGGTKDGGATVDRDWTDLSDAEKKRVREDSILEPSDFRRGDDE